MTHAEMPELRIGDIKTDLPIIQGGMGVGVSLSNLAAAVAENGGIGVIAATGIGMFEKDIGTNYRRANQRALARELRKAREKTEGPIGVNILMALTDCMDLIETAVKEKADFLFLGAGLPLKLPMGPEELRDMETKVVPIVSSAKAAGLIFKSWGRRYKRIPDAVVVEGPLAGGHIGFTIEQIGDPGYALENLLPEVISAVKPFENEFGKPVPVIAAGGIYSGSDIYGFMEMGAAGVQMGTRFVTTEECDAAPEFKEAYLSCREEDTVIIESPVGLPGRAIRNGFLENVIRGTKIPFKCPWKCLHTCDLDNAPYCIARALINAKRGFMERGFAFAGSNAGRTDEIIHVKELMETLDREYADAAGRGVKKKAV